jgi:hypothetical protein
MSATLPRLHVPADDVAALRLEVADLRVRVDALEAVRRRRLTAADREWLIRLLPAIHAAVGDGAWVLCELAALALLPGNAALAAALAPRMQRPGGLRALGKSLARGAGHVVGGFELFCVGESRDGRLWQAKRI